MSTEQSVPVNMYAARKGSISWKNIVKFVMQNGGYSAIGIFALLVAWWIGGWMIANDPDISSFADFAPQPAFARLLELAQNGSVMKAVIPSMERIGLGLLWAIISAINFIEIGVMPLRLTKCRYNM